MHIDQALVAVPLVVGLIGVALAVFERGYKRYLDAKKEDPTLVFDNSYLINILISAGGMSAVIAGVIPALVEMVPDVTTQLTLVSLIGNFLGGYLGTYRILDGLNNTTEQKVKLATATTKTTTTTEQQKEEQ